MHNADNSFYTGALFKELYVHLRNANISNYTCIKYYSAMKMYKCYKVGFSQEKCPATLDTGLCVDLASRSNS